MMGFVLFKLLTIFIINYIGFSSALEDVNNEWSLGVSHKSVLLANYCIDFGGK